MADKIKTALGVISGRIDKENIEVDEYTAIGYDVYTFGGLGEPEWCEVVIKAENIIGDRITRRCPYH